MSTLKELRDLHLQANTQFITTDSYGIVLESDDVLFKCQTGKSINDLHPFFISLNHSDLEKENTFTCVHLGVKDVSLTCDVIIKKDEDRLIIIIIDFSKHYNSFQSLAQSRNETAISSEFIEIDNYLLQKKEAFKNDFIANFNHELVSPILSILTFSNTLKKTQLSVNQKEYLEIINASGLTLKRMINDIFDITRIESGLLEVDNKRFSLEHLVKVIKKKYKKIIEAKGLEFKIVYDERMPTYIVNDKLRIEQIITNLIENAIKYTSQGSITLQLEPIYRRARKLTFLIKVFDTGIGINQQHFEYVFGRFNRLENNSNIEGSGLGLSITKDLVKLLGGEINLKSELNKGSEFAVTLRTTTPLNDLKPKKTLPEKDTLLNKKEVLLVEDNYSDQLSIFKILAESKKYFVDIATNGNEAVKLQRNKKYDLILMDYKMDSLDGFEASKSINKDVKTKTPIIIVTGLKIEPTILKHYSPYYANVLYKPFEAETLLTLLAEHTK